MRRLNTRFDEKVWNWFPFFFAAPFVIIVLVIVLIIGNGLLYNPLVIKHNATGQAEAYVKDMNRVLKREKYAFVGCPSDDHEHDGYATCTMLDLDVASQPGAKTEGTPISCTYKFFSSGCKPYTYNRSGGVVVPQ